MTTTRLAGSLWASAGQIDVAQGRTAIRAKRGDGSGVDFTISYTLASMKDDNALDRAFIRLPSLLNLGASATPGFQGGGTQWTDRPIAADYSWSDLDVRRTLTLSHVIELPFGRGRRLNSNAGRLVNGLIGREQGTLRQVLSLGVRRHDLMLGKAAGVAAALSLVFIPATVVGVVGLAMSAAAGSISNEVTRGLLLVLLYLVYFAIFVAISLGVSARLRSSRFALVVLLSFWFANSLVASRAASDLAAALAPAPSAAEFQSAMEKDLGAQLERRRQDLLRRYNAPSLDTVPINFLGAALQEGEEYGNDVFDRHYGRLFDTYDRQNHTYQWVGLAAPFLPMRALSMGLAGTDFAHHRQFVRAAEQYRRMIQRVMNDDISKNAKPGIAPR